uniref:BRCT domain-containing protein n=1 Tax=Soboliphyme baturini TaxID=241478 RepID=A0A183J4E8_9BILA
LQIRATEIVPSGAFGIGYTLRFPRVVKVREDKAWSDCMTVEEFLNLKEVYAGRLARIIDNRAMDGVDTRSSIHPRHKPSSSKPRPQLGTQFERAAVRDYDEKSTVFDGLEFCIINGSTSFPKKTLERLVLENGGSIVQHPTENTYCVVADRLVARVQSIIESGLYNVIKAQWRPHLMWYSTEATASQFKLTFDAYGDSFFEPVSIDDLKAIVSALSPMSLPRHKVMELIAELFPSYKYKLFYGLRVYVDFFGTVNNPESKINSSPLDIVELRLKLYGASIVDTVDETTTHIIVFSNDMSRVQALNQICSQICPNAILVTEQWVTDSVDRAALCDVSAYSPLK